MGFCDHDNEPSVSINARNFLTSLATVSFFLKKNPPAWIIRTSH